MARFILVLALVLSAIGSRAISGEQPREVRAAMVWSGTASKHTTREIVQCRTLSQWQSKWEQHAGHSNECPEIDFEKYMVVAIFLGKSQGEVGVRLSGVIEDEDRLRIRYFPIYRKLGDPKEALLPIESRTSDSEKGTVEAGTRAAVRCYVFVLLPQSVKTILVEENVGTVIGEPPEWVERCRFLPPERMKR